MSARDAFGPNLRRLRIQRGITLQRLADETKVGVDLWEGLEQNDFSRWPTGIYARSYLRAYAEHIGADPVATVDEFCRWFPQGDRRAERRLREHAAIVRHELTWSDDVAGAERRSVPREAVEQSHIRVLTRHGRLVAASADLGAVLVTTTVTASVVPVGWAAALGVCGLAYHAFTLLAIGCTPAAWLLDTYMTSHWPREWRKETPVFLRLVRRSHDVNPSTR
jgi:transcriptional regulator with XRE-family HTH domain